MKLFKKTILAMMAVAVCAGFTACSDDDDYVPGAQSPGAFFSQTNPSAIEVNLEATSFAVTVQRTSTSAPAAYELSIEGGEGLFSVPSTVNFAADALTADVLVSFDPAKVAQDKAYSLKLNLGHASQYGAAAYALTFKRAMPLVTEKFECGQGTYIYNNFAEGAADGMPIYITYNPEQPTKNIVYTLPTFGAGVFTEKGVKMEILVADSEERDSYGDIAVSVPGIFTGYYNNEGLPIYVADLKWFFENVYISPGNAAKSTPGWYTEETGTFALNVIYYLPDKPGSYHGVYNELEYFQMDGYPDYEVSIDWNGFVIDTQMNMSASLTTHAGEDIASVRVACLPTTDEQSVLYACLTNAEGVVEVGGGENTVTFPVKDQGMYTAVAVGYNAAGEAQKYDVVTFENSFGAAEEDLSDYDSVGSVEIVDGWVVPMWSIDGVTLDALKYRYSTELLKSKSQAGEYVMVRPWGPKHPLYELNTTPNKKCNIHIRISNNSCVIDPQLSGFGTSSRPEFYIGNYEGAVATANEVDDATAIAWVQKNHPEYATTFEDDIVNIALPMFDGEQGFGYNWKVVQPSVLVLPSEDGAEAPAKKVVAKRVAKPAVRGMRASMKDNAQKRNRMDLLITRTMPAKPVMKSKAQMNLLRQK